MRYSFVDLVGPAGTEGVTVEAKAMAYSVAAKTANMRSRLAVTLAGISRCF